MPFEKDDSYETAKTNTQKFIIQDPKISRKLSNIETITFDELESDLENNIYDIEPNNNIDTIYAVDGSYTEVEMDNNGSRIGFVLIGIIKFSTSDIYSTGSVTPQKLEEQVEKERLQFILPGAGVSFKQQESLEESFRRLFWEQLSNEEVFGIELYDVLKQLCGESESIRIENCPVPECRARDNTINVYGESEQQGLTSFCSSCKSPLYPSDKIDLYRYVKDYGSNEQVYRASMSALENLTVAAITEEINTNGNPDTTAIIKDGPLSHHTGGEEWMSNNLIQYFDEKQENGKPLIMGVKKSGQFNKHGETVTDYLERGNVLALPNDYIYQHIRTTSSNSIYGDDIYYGKHFIYKNKNGEIYVFNLRRRKMKNKYRLVHSPDEFPELNSAISVLDRLHTRQYDGLVPLEKAHETASISNKKMVTHALEQFLDNRN